MEIAVFGGTFDPPTLAHEAIIQTCLDRTDIDEVWVMPSGKRPDKPDMQDDQTRLKLLELVKQHTFYNDPRLKIADFEMRLEQPTQTYKTVAALEEAYPEHRFWFIFGADSYHDMPNWRGGEQLQRILGMLLVPRAGYELPEQSMNIRHLHIEDKGMSSTKVRELVRAGKQASAFVSPSVEKILCDIYHT